MKITVIGGTGLIGSKLVNSLRQLGHEVIAASPSSGVNTITGEGLAEALKGTQVVVDVANAPSFEDNAVLAFFQTSGHNLLTASASAGIGHFIALSVVGTERLQESGYFRAKQVQENIIKAAKIPYTIVHSTQFFEFVAGIAQSGIVGEKIHMSPALIQPIASDDVVAAIVPIVTGTPINGTIEIAGPEQFRLDELVRKFFGLTHSTQEVVTDVHARYFGAALNDKTLVPGDNPRIGSIRYEDWFKKQSQL
ncbi:SDR family oxidoreductase [Flavobacterium sp.]|uniref:SDR family oxidoreductase n=1 Tax=Flavobacterium sp. TaxID=239 RepID=UPI003D6A09AF